MREKIKITFSIAVFALIFVGMIIYGLDRFEKIDNGQMTLVNQNQMDR